MSSWHSLKQFVDMMIALAHVSTGQTSLLVRCSEAYAPLPKDEKLQPAFASLRPTPLCLAKNGCYHLHKSHRGLRPYDTHKTKAPTSKPLVPSSFSRKGPLSVQPDWAPSHAHVKMLFSLVEWRLCAPSAIARAPSSKRNQTTRT